MTKLILKEWKPGLKKVSLTKILQQEAGLPLTSAKECVDHLLNNKPTTVTIENAEAAVKLAVEISKLGAICEVILATKNRICHICNVYRYRRLLRVR